MDGPERQVFRFEDVEVDLARGCVTRGGDEVHLRRKSFEVLAYLLAHPGRLITKNELFENVWNNTAVTDDVLVQCIKEVRRSLGDDPHRARFIKTVPKAGYRFVADLDERSQAVIEEITQVEIEVETETESAGSGVMVKLRAVAAGFLPRYAATAGVVFICVAAALSYLGWRSSSQAADSILRRPEGKTTLAVMYFENRTGDPGLEWMREGLAEMLITNLSRSDKLDVVSRGELQRALEKEGAGAGAITLDRSLAVAKRTASEAVAAGSFTKAGEKIRLDVQLHDAETGELTAAESLTVDRVEQILTDIDLLSFRLLRHFGGAENADSANFTSVMTNDLEAFRCYSLALEKASGLNKTEALRLLERAVELDPEFAMAHARIGHTYAVTWGWAEKAKPHLQRAFELSSRLTEKDRLYIVAWYAIANLDYGAAIRSFREIVDKYPDETEAYLRLGYLLRGEEQFDEAITVMRRGLAVDPESAPMYNALGLLYSLMGRHDEAIAMHERYVALAPAEANAYDSLGMSYQWAGRYEEALAAYDRALQMDPKFEIVPAHIGVVYFQTGRYAKAIEWFRRYIAVAPSKLESSRGHSYIAHVHRKAGRPKEAQAAAMQAMREHSSSVWEYVALAAERGDERTVQKYEAELFGDDKFSNRGSRNSPRFKNYYRGYLALEFGRVDEAIGHFQRTLQHAPATWDIDPFEDCLGRAYLELGRNDEAIAEFQRVLRLNPRYPLANYHLGRAFLARGMTSEAMNSFQVFLSDVRDADAWAAETNDARRLLGQS